MKCHPRHQFQNQPPQYSTLQVVCQVHLPFPSLVIQERLLHSFLSFILPVFYIICVLLRIIKHTSFHIHHIKMVFEGGLNAIALFLIVTFGGCLYLLFVFVGIAVPEISNCCNKINPARCFIKSKDNNNQRTVSFAADNN